MEGHSKNYHENSLRCLKIPFKGELMFNVQILLHPNTKITIMQEWSSQINHKLLMECFLNENVFILQGEMFKKKPFNWWIYFSHMNYPLSTFAKWFLNCIKS
jgi:hypothetical protein